MKIGKAVAVFVQLDSDKYTDIEKAEAINDVINMPTHNSITKADLISAIKYLWDKIYECERVNSGND